MDRFYVDPNFVEDLRKAMAKWTSWLKAEIEAGKSSVDQIVDQNSE